MADTAIFPTLNGVNQVISTLAAATQNKASTKSLHQLEDMIDQNGNPVSWENDLKGEIFVANFIFTRCPGACPITTRNMAGLQYELAKRHEENPDLGWDTVKLVSISVDPEVDRPGPLKDYAAEKTQNYLKRWDIAPEGVPEQLNEWLLLTLSEEKMAELRAERGMSPYQQIDWQAQDDRGGLKHTENNTGYTRLEDFRYHTARGYNLNDFVKPMRWMAHSSELLLHNAEGYALLPRGDDRNAWIRESGQEEQRKVGLLFDGLLEDIEKELIFRKGQEQAIGHEPAAKRAGMGI